jgi:VanZ family protein
MHETSEYDKPGRDAQQRLINIAILCLLATASYFLLYGGPDAYAARSVKELWNVGHVAYFALLTLLLARIKTIARLPASYQWPGILVLTLILGIAIEIMQHGTGRTPDIADISRNFVGCLLALSFTPAYTRSFAMRWRNMLRRISVLILAISSLHLLIAITDEQIARLQFPVLSDFSTPFESDRWRSTASTRVVELEHGTDGRQMEVIFTSGQLTGVHMIYLSTNWTEYKSVNLRLYSPYSELLPITIRTHDREHAIGAHKFENEDRFQKRFQLEPGWNQISIPLTDIIDAVSTRKINLTDMQDIGLFTWPKHESRTIYIDSIYLQ